MILLWILGGLALVTIVYSFAGLLLDDQKQWQFDSTVLKPNASKKKED